MVSIDPCQFSAKIYDAFFVKPLHFSGQLFSGLHLAAGQCKFIITRQGR